MHDKIQPHHLARKAMLSVRQSSAYQVIHNPESGKLQYAMTTRLRQLGWHDIEVIDDDLGRSAAGTGRRSGFERRSYWIPGSYAPVLSEKRNAFSGLLNNKGSKEERKTQVGLDAIDTSTTLESNKSHSDTLSEEA